MIPVAYDDTHTHKHTHTHTHTCTGAWIYISAVFVIKRNVYNTCITVNMKYKN